MIFVASLLFLLKCDSHTTYDHNLAFSNFVMTCKTWAYLIHLFTSYYSIVGQRSLQWSLSVVRVCQDTYSIVWVATLFFLLTFSENARPLFVGYAFSVNLCKRKIKKYWTHGPKSMEVLAAKWCSLTFVIITWRD